MHGRELGNLSLIPASLSPKRESKDTASPMDTTDDADDVVIVGSNISSRQMGRAASNPLHDLISKGEFKTIKTQDKKELAKSLYDTCQGVTPIAHAIHHGKITIASYFINLAVTEGLDDKTISPTVSPGTLVKLKNILDSFFVEIPDDQLNEFVSRAINGLEDLEDTEELPEYSILVELYKQIIFQLFRIGASVSSKEMTDRLNQLSIADQMQKKVLEQSHIESLLRELDVCLQATQYLILTDAELEMVKEAAFRRNATNAKLAPIIVKLKQAPVLDYPAVRIVEILQTFVHHTEHQKLEDCKLDIQERFDPRYLKRKNNNYYYTFLEDKIHRLTMITKGTDTIGLQLISSLVYESKRHPNFQQDPCALLHRLIQKIDPSLAKPDIPSYEKFIYEKESDLSDYFGECLSDNSDSEDEKAYDKLPHRKKSISQTFTSKLFDRSKTDLLLLTKANGKTARKLKKVPDDGVRSKKKDNDRDHDYRLERQQIMHDQPIPHEVSKDLERLNALAITGNLNETTIKSISTPFFVAQYRGLAHSIKQWGKADRFSHRTTHEEDQPLFSASVFVASGYSSFRDYFCDSADSEKTNRLVVCGESLQDQMLQLTSIGPVYRPLPDENACFTFDHALHEVQNTYSNGYDKFHTKLKTFHAKYISKPMYVAISSEEDAILLSLFHPENPFVSTADVPEHAERYAYGDKPYAGHRDSRLRPRWRKDGRVERPYSGKVYVSLHTPLEVMQYTNHVVSLSWNGQLDNISRNIIPEKETSFLGFIPPERVVSQHVAKFPSFHSDYKAIYFEKYGLTSDLYDVFQQNILKSKPHSKNPDGKRSKKAKDKKEKEEKKDSPKDKEKVTSKAKPPTPPSNVKPATINKADEDSDGDEAMPDIQAEQKKPYNRENVTRAVTFHLVSFHETSLIEEARIAALNIGKVECGRPGYLVYRSEYGGFSFHPSKPKEISRTNDKRRESAATATHQDLRSRRDARKIKRDDPEKKENFLTVLLKEFKIIPAKDDKNSLAECMAFLLGDLKKKPLFVPELAPPASADTLAFFKRKRPESVQEYFKRCLTFLRGIAVTYKVKIIIYNPEFKDKTLEIQPDAPPIDKTIHLYYVGGTRFAMLYNVNTPFPEMVKLPQDQGKSESKDGKKENDKKRKSRDEKDQKKEDSPPEKKRKSAPEKSSSGNSSGTSSGVSQFHQELIFAMTKWGDAAVTLALTASTKEQSSAPALKLQAAVWNFNCEDMKHDGNCFFHAISDQLIRIGIAMPHDTIRAKAADHILRNFSYYRSSIDENPNTFIEKITRQGTWADHQIIQAISRELNVTIVIIRSDGKAPQIIRQAKPDAVLYLGYEVGRHYQSLVARSQLHSGPNVQDKINHAEIDPFSSQSDSKSVPMQDEEKDSSKISTAEMMKAFPAAEPTPKTPATQLPKTPTHKPSSPHPLSLMYPPPPSGNISPAGTAKKLLSKGRANTLRR